MSALFTPLRLRELDIPNRIWVSPMCMYACEDEDGRVHDWHVAHYGQFALGRAGMIVTEATAVLPEGRVTPQDAGLWDETHVAAWRRVTELVHREGSTIAVQLAHAGRKGSKYRGLPGDVASGSSVPPAAGGWRTVGATGAPFGRYDAPDAAEATAITAVIEAFGVAAQRADAAGFDAIEIHGAHGYLLHEFLSPLTGVRDDAWSGSVAARERLLLAVVDAVRANWPATKPLLVRLSVDDVAPGGSTAADSADLAVRLAERGVDLIDCSSGGLLPGIDYAAAPGYQVPGSRTVRASGLPTAAVGIITEPEQAERIVAEGAADAVLLGRAMLADPQWAARAARTLGLPEAGALNPRYHRAH